MKTNTKGSTFKTAIASGLAVVLLSTAVGGTANAASYAEQQIYRDGKFGQIANQLRQNLRSSGYYVMDIKADGGDHIKVYAKKNNKPYELRYTYPGLKLISTEQKAWSNVWQDKNNHHNSYNNNDIEDKIKNESRFAAIKQKAINKLSNQGYKVTDIELEEQNNKGVFEIEAERGNQDYDIVLSYPDLSVIKLQKD